MKHFWDFLLRIFSHGSATPSINTRNLHVADENKAKIISECENKFPYITKYC